MIVGADANVVNVNKVVETGTPKRVKTNKQTSAIKNLYLNYTGYGI